MAVLPLADRPVLSLGAPPARPLIGRLEAGQAVFAPVLALVVLAPLPEALGAAWAEAALAVALGALALAAAGLAAIGLVEFPVRLGRLWPAALPFGLVMLWIAVQATGPVPTSLAHPLWTVAQGALSPEAAVLVEPRVTLDPLATSDGLMRLLVFAAGFWLALQFGRASARAGQALGALAAGGALWAVVAMVQRLAAGHGLHGGTLTHVAEVASPLAALGLVAGLALLIGRLAEARASATSRRAALSRLIEVLISRAGTLGIAIILCAGCLLLTHHRAGILAAVAGIFALCLALCTAPSLAILRRRSLLLPTLGIFLAALVAGAWGLAKGDGGVKAIAETAAVSTATADAIADAPFTGTGYGTFAEALRPYRDAAMPERLETSRNAFLAAALELGTPAALLFIVAGLALLGLFALGVWRRQRNAVFACAGAGGLALLAVAGGAGALAGGGAVALAAAVLLGTAAAQSFRTGK